MLVDQNCFVDIRAVFLMTHPKLEYPKHFWLTQSFRPWNWNMNESLLSIDGY